MIQRNTGLYFIGMVLPLLIAAIPGQAAEQDIQRTMTTSRSHLSKAELSLWNEPDFRRQFAESYLAETEIEPRVTTNEREKMLKVLGLISSDKMDEAALLLEKNRGSAASAVFDFTLANIYFQQADLKEIAEEAREEKLGRAVSAYQMAVDKFPKFRRAWKNLALIHVRQGEYKKALPELVRVVELGGNDALTYGLLGYAYSSIENHLSGESAYRMAIMLDPDTLDWKMGLARSFFKQERFAEAVALCGQLIEGQPNRADLWLLQANAYLGLNQPLQAAKNYVLVDRLGKSSVESLTILGDIYINEGLYEMAVNAYVGAMEKKPQGDINRVIRAAKVLTGHGALKETRQLIEQIERLRGDQLKMDDRKDLLKLRARLAVADGSGDEEVRVLEKIVALDPLDGEAIILLGQHSRRIGDDEKAIFYYERAAAIDGFEADAKVHHAQLLVGKGKYHEALPLLRRAQFLNPRDNVQKYLKQIERIAKTH